MKELQTVPEMATVLTEHKFCDGHTSKIYKAAADQHKGEELSANLENRIEALKTSTQRGPVDWNNIEQVKERVFSYLTACAQSKTYPSIMGLSFHGFGISRQALCKYLSKYPDSLSAIFISMTKDLIADLLTNAALYRNADPVSVIFQLKNHFEHSDKLQLEPIRQESPLGSEVSAAELAAHYQDLVED